MKNIFLIALSLIYDFQMYLQQDFLIEFFLLFTQFYLLILYFIYNNLKKFAKRLTN